MTQIWGPLGWMTLHSISLNYPDDPTQSDKSILDSFITNFAECITCPSCRSHFQTILKLYKINHPEWNSSRFQLFLFIARAHNTVNKKLDKPILYTVADCLEKIKSINRITHLSIFRKNYINHVSRNWQREFTAEGRIMVGFIKEVEKINELYWSIREPDINLIVFPEANVVEFIEVNKTAPTGIYSFMSPAVFNKGVGFKITGGRLKLGGM
jgi:hypothetical protein